jgi:uncharacterized membrane protein
MKTYVVRILISALAAASIVAAGATLAFAAAGTPALPEGCNSGCTVGQSDCAGQFCSSCTWESYMHYICRPVE